MMQRARVLSDLHLGLNVCGLAKKSDYGIFQDYIKDFDIVQTQLILITFPDFIISRDRKEISLSHLAEHMD